MESINFLSFIHFVCFSWFFVVVDVWFFHTFIQFYDITQKFLFYFTYSMKGHSFDYPPVIRWFIYHGIFQCMQCMLSFSLFSIVYRNIHLFIFVYTYMNTDSHLIEYIVKFNLWFFCWNFGRQHQTCKLWLELNILNLNAFNCENSSGFTLNLFW